LKAVSLNGFVRSPSFRTADLERWAVIWLMGVLRRSPGRDAFASFVERVKPALLQALIATYGPVDGREACVDALSWAWEHWDRLANIDHPVSYLYRVGQSATRRFLPKPIPVRLAEIIETRFPEIEPELLPALSRLSEQQRTVVVLVHGYGWRQAEVARLLGVNPSTVRDYLTRAVDRLRNELEVHDVN
jgi:RNA polymerase sigma factor (sigma-70 family)